MTATRTLRHTVAIIIAILLPALPPAEARGKGRAELVGLWQCRLGQQSVPLAILPHGVLSFDGAAARYTVAGQTLRVLQQGQWVSYPFRAAGKGRARRVTLTMPDRRPLRCSPLGRGKERQLRGMLCSWSGSSSSYAGTSISRTTRVVFDGKGNLRYASEGGFSGPDGLVHNRSGAQRGLYRVVGKAVYLVFPDGDGAVARVHMRQADGRITELKHGRTLFAAGLCK
jgi:hypothetical protein